jgi:hypothetical protein
MLLELVCLCCDEKDGEGWLFIAFFIAKANRALTSILR